MHPGDVFCADGDGMIVLRGEHLLNAIERAHQDAATEDRHVDSAGASSQRPGEAELVTIWIGQVEEPLAPFGIARRRIWAVAGRDYSRMEGVNVVVVEDHASPPGPLALGRLRELIGGSTTLEPQTLHSKICRGDVSVGLAGQYSTSHMGTSHVGQMGCWLFEDVSGPLGTASVAL